MISHHWQVEGDVVPCRIQLVSGGHDPQGSAVDQQCLKNAHNSWKGKIQGETLYVNIFDHG
jgi:hypothetical protein